MKINIGPYKNWFGPYQLAEALCFWAKDVKDEHGFKSKPDWILTFGDFLAHGTAALKDKKRRDVFNRDEDLPETLLYRALKWIDSKKKRRVYIRIDKYDTWNMDGTLSMIILPMLKQLKATKHGSPHVDLEDLPEHLRKDFKADDEYEIIHVRWAWVLDEMIWAFEQHQPDVDWEAQYSTGVIDFRTEPSYLDENGKPRLYRLIHGPKHTHETDWEARAVHQKRIDNGFRLFGKYYQGLWD
jgi:hypothetical protein